MEKIALSRAINKQTSIVTSKGESYKEKRPKGMILTQKPIPYTNYKNPKGYDCTGVVLGDLKILGFRPKRGAQCNGRWVFKCTCGNYGTLTTKAIKNKSVNCCFDCKKRKEMRNKYSTIKGIK